MSSTFSGISSALSALQANRKAMDVTGENIANVATPGYTRQRVELASAVTSGATAVNAGGMAGGSGVVVTGTTRLASDFWNAQVNSQTSLHADLAQRADTLAQLEGTTGEPADGALSGDLSKMWAAWSNLANNVGSTGEAAAKSVVVNASNKVAATLRSNYAAVDSQWTDTRAQTSSLVSEVNSTASTVAALNARIATALNSGSEANELQDQRDQAVTRLAELTGATSSKAANGAIDVFVGNSALVRGSTSSAVVLGGPTTMGGVDTSTTPPSVVSLTFANGNPAQLTGGQIAASLDDLNTTIAGAGKGYDAIAASVAGAVNGAIAAAYGATATGGTLAGGDTWVRNTAPVFFSGTTASGATALTVNATAVVNAVSGTATHTGPPASTYTTYVNGSADASVATAVSKLAKSTTGPDAAWKASVADLGARSSTAAAQATSAAATLANAVSSQQSETGVDIDEETANLLVVQRAYQAASRVLTAVDQMLDTLINSTGMVGR